MIFGKVDLNHQANRRARQQPHHGATDQLYCRITAPLLRNKLPGQNKTTTLLELDRMII